jgi:hypothetical protein
MKKSLYLCGLMAMTLAGTASAAVVVEDADWTVNASIPEGNPVGITEYQTFSGLSGAPISDVSVDLNITGGYNGILYGYLVLQDANGNVATEVLLNQIGTSAANQFGSSGAGMDVTLSDSGTVNGTIHNATGVPTGAWQPDSANTLDGTYGGLTANGTWTLFLADLGTGGSQSTLVSWGLDISAVPESSPTGLLTGLGALLVVSAGSLLKTKRLNFHTGKKL